MGYDMGYGAPSQEDILIATLSNTLQRQVLNQPGYKFMFLPVVGQNGLDIEWDASEGTIWCKVGGWGFPFRPERDDPDAIFELAGQMYSFFQLSSRAKPMESTNHAKPLNLDYQKQVPVQKRQPAKPQPRVQKGRKMNESDCPSKTLFAQILEEMGIKS